MTGEMDVIQVLIYVMKSILRIVKKSCSWNGWKKTNLIIR